ncbi:MAG: hypothetical protein AUJ52_14800 [Elusimicrobia bacterium CG1_02_63_36]|nr:MAG: hypothetical protein AUJ52_14800 [Elusimicrobia bacterium CG1_02_63_36]PIP82133.1 MAG: hypothetical protein COR54_16455 [Elusimicrobia bacterium CG22_combo_CG10-13_8_21_14_all_63_91]PJA11785.1 MAG: hypothetical protein COX66_18900 [Elusimicrobia bacterium CG_4_10_14_0_2_um_filter_63_34]PJB24977.1 MAG: hypothetical protein CO113_11085 [Elusimicrobia bacterium CG_4_9_14_3_um_filter_62_55]
MRPQDIVSARDACQLLGISRPTLYSWIEQGKLKPWGKVGGNEAWIFLRTEVLKAHGTKYQRIK